MWCRTILTAVAISYVVCVLLLSGLQKEDLDADTLEKLRRHHVNIDDKNNTNLRQECAIKAYSDAENATQENETTDDQNEALVTTSTNKSDYKDVNIEEFIKLEMLTPKNFTNKSDIQNGIENNEKEHSSSRLKTRSDNFKTNNVIANTHSLGTVSKIEENNGLQIEYIQNQPSLQSVMNFWTKLTHNSKKVITKVVTTTTPPDVSEKNNESITKVETSQNNGYVHSREMEYIGRILAEYLASQTVPTTTQRVTTKNIYVSSTSTKTEELLEITSTDEELKPPKNINFLKKINNSTRKSVKFPENYMTDETKNKPPKTIYYSNQQTDGMQINEHPQKNSNEYIMSEESKWSPHKERYGYNNQIKSNPVSTYNNVKNNITDIPYYNQLLRFSTKTAESKRIDNINPIRFLENLLRSDGVFKINSTPISYTVTTTETMKLISEENEQKDLIESYNRYKKKIKGVNNDNYKKTDQIYMWGINNDQFRGIQTETRAWDPVRNYRMVNKLFKFLSTDENENKEEKKLKITNDKITPAIMKNLGQANNFKVNDPFKFVPSNVKNLTQNKNLNNGFENKLADNTKYGQRNIVDIEHGQYEDLPADVKKSRINSNGFIPSEINNPEQTQIYRLYDDQLKAIETIQSERNHISENLNVGYYDKQRKPIPAILKESNRIQDSKNPFQEKPQSMNHAKRKKKFNMIDNNVQAPVDDTEIIQNQKEEMNSYKPQTIPVNVIREIAESIKQIVLKDIRKSASTTFPTTTTTVPTTTTTISTTTTTLPTTMTTVSTTTTSVPTTTTAVIITTKATAKTEKPHILQGQIKEENHVMQKLMDMFNEFKAMKDTLKPTSMSPQNVIHYQQPPVQTNRPELASFNPYIIKSPPIMVKPIEVSPYGPSMVPIPISSGANLPQNQVSQYMQFKSQEKSDYRLPAITIQTNAEEIAPLAIHISKPLRLMNQQIIVTTKSPSEKLKEILERESMKRFDERYQGIDLVKNEKEVHLQSEVVKKVRFANSTKKDEHNNRYLSKARLNKGRERPNYLHEYSETIRDINHLENLSHPGSSNYLGDLNKPRLSYSGGLSNPAGSSYRASLSNLAGSGYSGGLSNPAGSSYKASLSNLAGSSYSGGLSNPAGSSYKASLSNLAGSSYSGGLSNLAGSSYPGGLSNLAGSSYSGGLSNPIGTSYSGSLSRPRGLTHLDEFRNTGGLTYSGSLSDPDRISHSRGFIRPVGSRQDVINVHERTYGNSDHERPRTRYEATKFHEKLERIESWPRNKWKGYREKTKEDCSDNISPRQQMPLIKVKKRSRYDDTHFTNFLKSQQKVTDMLEKILANNMKSNAQAHSSHSVELP